MGSKRFETHESMSSCAQSLIRTSTAKPENKATLPKVLLRCLLQPFIAVIIPRLFLTTFRYGQPVLIRRAIRFVTEATTSENSSVAGYWIIITAIIVYIGLAVRPFNPFVLLKLTKFSGVCFGLQTWLQPAQGNDTRLSCRTDPQCNAYRPR